ncbi:uncharacterized protein LOC134210016 isoform X2 [Armigeres subalbatus]
MFQNRTSVIQSPSISRHPVGFPLRRNPGHYVLYPAPLHPWVLNNVASYQHQPHSSVVRYFQSLTDDAPCSSSAAGHPEPDYARDVEVLVVHRKASYKDFVRSKDKTYRKLLDMFDWDAMKLPVQGQSSETVHSIEESESGEETDSADESEPHQHQVVHYPRIELIRKYFRYDEPVLRFRMYIPTDFNGSIAGSYVPSGERVWDKVPDY